MTPTKTISIDCILLKRLQLCVCTLLLAGCNAAATPPCPLPDSGDRAPSAGCFAQDNSRLLVVQALNGKLSLPGGSSNLGESAQCTAFRETWEETGLRLQPRELVRVFDTGFHLYRCQRDANSGEIDPPPRLEVRDAFYLASEQFSDWDWRFAEQEQLLLQLMRTSGSGPAGPAPSPAR